MSEFYKQLTCTHERLQYEFEQDDNNMPFLVSAVCEDCNKEVIDQLPDQIRFDIEDAYLEDEMGVHYNAEAQHEYF